MTAAAIIVVVACLCARKIRNRNKKTQETTLPFQPTKRPTAVRSPSGAPPHYLKKSPSPTATKPLPGSLQTPDQQLSRYTEENESIHKNFLNGIKTPEIKTPDDDSENGKLGTLIFKLRYMVEKTALVVSVVKCRGLPSKATAVSSDLPVGTNGKVQNATDPYVKLQLLPDKQHKVKTR